MKQYLGKNPAEEWVWVYCTEHHRQNPHDLGSGIQVIHTAVSSYTPEMSCHLSPGWPKQVCDSCEGFTIIRMMAVKVVDLLKHLDNWLESAREDRWVPVNKMAADFTVMFCETLPAQGCAEMQIPVRSWDTYRREEFRYFLRIWKILGAAYQGKMGSIKIKIGPRSWHL